MTTCVATRLNARKMRLLLGMLPFVLGTGAELCRAQSATVTFQIEMPDKEMKNGLRIRAIQKTPGTRTKTQELTKSDYNYTTHVYMHKIDRLPAGTYYFVLCDGRQYKPQMKTGTLQPGQTLGVSFLPEDQSTGNDKIDEVLEGAEGRHADAGIAVFLKDMTTGCTVDQATTDREGKYQFAGLPGKVKYGVSTDELDSEPSTATVHE